MSTIGLLNEKPLHSLLKEWYAQPGDRTEVSVDGYVIDIIHDDVLIEIQTANFSSAKTKLEKLTENHRVQLVYPVAGEKWIVKQENDSNDVISRRKSPKKGRVEDVFYELVSFPHLLMNPNFSLDVLLIKEEEVRSYNAKKNWRRKGWGIVERRLLGIIERKTFYSTTDLKTLLPKQIGEKFTTNDLSAATGISKPLAQKMVYCFHKANAIELIGKQNRFNLYRVDKTY